jgi:hypothetical protein
MTKDPFADMEKLLDRIESAPPDEEKIELMRQLEEAKKRIAARENQGLYLPDISQIIKSGKITTEENILIIEKIVSGSENSIEATYLMRKEDLSLYLDLLPHGRLWGAEIRLNLKVIIDLSLRFDLKYKIWGNPIPEIYFDETLISRNRTDQLLSPPKNSGERIETNTVYLGNVTKGQHRLKLNSINPSAEVKSATFWRT